MLRYAPPDLPVYMLPEEVAFPVNTDLDWSAIEHEYLSNDPGIVYVDNFLTQPALAIIRQLCLESTTFWDVRGTYVGAYMQTGFFSHTIFRIAEELRRVLPNVVGNKRLQGVWSYKVGLQSCWRGATAATNASWFAHLVPPRCFIVCAWLWSVWQYMDNQRASRWLARRLSLHSLGCACVCCRVVSWYSRHQEALR